MDQCARYLFILQHSDNHQQSLMINTRLLAAFFFNVISIHAEKDDRNLLSKQTETTPGQPDVHIDCKSYISDMSDAKIDVYHIARRLKSCPLRKHKEAFIGASNAIGVNVFKFTAFLTLHKKYQLDKYYKNIDRDITKTLDVMKKKKVRCKTYADNFLDKVGKLVLYIIVTCNP